MLSVADPDSLFAERHQHMISKTLLIEKKKGAICSYSKNFTEEERHLVIAVFLQRNKRWESRQILYTARTSCL